MQSEFHPCRADGGDCAVHGIHGSPATKAHRVARLVCVSASQKALPEVQCLTSMLPSSRRRGKETRTKALQDLMAESRSGSTSEYLEARSKFSFTISRKRGSSSGLSTGPAMSESSVYNAATFPEAHIKLATRAVNIIQNYQRTCVGEQIGVRCLPVGGCGKCTAGHWGASHPGGGAGNTRQHLDWRLRPSTTQYLYGKSLFGQALVRQKPSALQRDTHQQPPQPHSAARQPQAPAAHSIRSTNDSTPHPCCRKHTINTMHRSGFLQQQSAFMRWMHGISTQRASHEHRNV